MARLISVSEGAEKYGLDPKVVYDAASDGIFGDSGIVVRFGRRVKLNEEKFDQFIETGGNALPGGWRKEPLQEREAA